jgi:7-cyano-7-deazaguanine synthase
MNTINDIMPQQKAIVLLSGGMDSLVCLYWAKQRFSEVHGVSFAYGQRNAAAELGAARKLALALKLDSHAVIPLRLAGGLASPLVPLGTYNSSEDIRRQREAGKAEPSIVPGRNLIFLAVATNYAQTLGVNALVLGLVDGRGSDYSDCRPEFVMAANEALRQSLGQSIADAIRVRAPLILLDKAGVILTALEYSGCYANFAYTHSAYDDSFPPGSDRASVQRAQGFFTARVPDPLIYRAWQERRLAELPDTSNYDLCRDGSMSIMEIEQNLRGMLVG